MGNIRGNYQNLQIVDGLYDFPTPSSGVITLAANTTYLINRNLDLAGNRLVGSQNTVILGHSSEVSSLTSTLSSGQKLISSAYSLPMRHISLSVSGSGAEILALDASANSGQALDWYGVNFIGGIIGTIKGYSNVVIASTAVLSAVDGFTFDGTTGTIAFSDTLFSGMTGTGKYIIVPATANITRRFRVIYSSFVATGSTTAIDFSSSATVSDESYILDNVNFSGGATYLAGVQSTDNKARFQENRGINNSSEVGYMYMLNNATATTITATNTPVKVAGTTTSGSITQKFSHASNKLTYTGSLTRNFKITGVLSLSSGANNQIGVYVVQNGALITESEAYVTANSGGRLENATVQAAVTLATGDYIEIYVENATAITNITVDFLNVMVEAIG